MEDTILNMETKLEQAQTLLTILIDIANVDDTHTTTGAIALAREKEKIIDLALITLDFVHTVNESLDTLLVSTTRETNGV